MLSCVPLHCVLHDVPCGAVLCCVVRCSVCCTVLLSSFVTHKDRSKSIGNANATLVLSQTLTLPPLLPETLPLQLTLPLTRMLVLILSLSLSHVLCTESGVATGTDPPPPSPSLSLSLNRGHGGGNTEMVEDNCRDGGRPTHIRGTPEQTGARARAHVVSKQILIVLATNKFSMAHARMQAESIAQCIGTRQMA